MDEERKLSTAEALQAKKDLKLEAYKQIIREQANIIEKQSKIITGLT